MVKFSRHAINPVFPTKITEGFELSSMGMDLGVGIAIPVSSSGFMVSYPYMDYASPRSNTYAELAHIVPTDLPNSMDVVVRNEIMYNKMLENRIQRAQNGYYQSLSGAINQSPVLSKMNIDVPFPEDVKSSNIEQSSPSIESFMYSMTTGNTKNMLFILLVIAIIAVFAYITMKK